MAKVISNAICVCAVTDGVDGTDGKGIVSTNIFFGISESNIIEPDTFPYDTIDGNLSYGMYLWQTTKITYTDDTTSTTGSICLGECEEFASVTEQYAIGTESVATSSWSDSYTATKGSWIWQRTRLKYNSTDNGYQYVPSESGKRIGFFGNDGSDGNDGSEGITISLNPSQHIFQQSSDGSIPSSTVSVDAYTAEGTNLAYTIVSFTVSKDLTYKGQSINTCTASVSSDNKYISISSIGTYGGDYNKPFESGYIDITVRVTLPSGSTIDKTMRYNWVANLVGTYTTIITEDVEKTVSEKKYSVYDDDGNVISTQTIGDYVKSSSESTSKLTKSVSGGVNLLYNGGFVQGDGLENWHYNRASTVPGTPSLNANKLSGVSNIVSFPALSTGDGLFTTGKMEDTQTTFTAGTYYTLSAYVYCTSSISLWFGAESVVDYNNSACTTKVQVGACDGDIADVGSWKRVSFTFVPKTTTTSSLVFYLGADLSSAATLNLAGTQLEIGKIATTFSFGLVETSSLVSQSTDSIIAKVGHCGLDISAKKFVAVADKFEVHNSSGNSTFTIDSDGNIIGAGNATIKGNLTVKGALLFDKMYWHKRTSSDNTSLDLATYNFDSNNKIVSIASILGSTIVLDGFVAQNGTSTFNFNLPDPKLMGEGFVLQIINRMFQVTISGSSYVISSQTTINVNVDTVGLTESEWLSTTPHQIYSDSYADNNGLNMPFMDVSDMMALNTNCTWWNLNMTSFASITLKVAKTDRYYWIVTDAKPRS